MVTTTELVKYLKIGRNTVTRLIRKGMPHYQIGSEYRFELDDVKEWLKEQTVKGEE